MNKFLTSVMHFSLFLIMTSVLFSCAKDDLLEDPTAGFESADLRATIGRSTTSCVKSLNALISNGSLNIGCVSDLKGQTINLPKGADIKFDGGTILNGTLHFNGGTLDGRLLNKDLKITGKVTLLNNTYTFEPDQWGIKQGNVNKAQAWDNLVNMRAAINTVKKLGGNTIEVGALDVHLGIGNHKRNPNWYAAEEGISIPSNFTLKMSDNTHLRVFPNGDKRYALVGMRGTNNSVVDGGHLHGDRDKHQFTGGGTHEWGALVEIEGAQNSTVRNVSMEGANGDGMTIHSLRFTFQPDYRPAKNILIDNCTFDGNRRNNMAITDGQDLVVQNSTFLNAGVDTPHSKGTNPRFAIDVEAHRERHNGKIVYYERVDGLIIRNNVEKGGARGGFLVSIGDNVIMESNTVEDGLAYRYGIGTIIRNNTLKARTKGKGTAIMGGIAGTETISNNKIYGNKIYNYHQGIILYGKDHKVYDNELVANNDGLVVKDVRSSKIYNNTITSNLNRSRGIFAHFTSLDDVEFSNNVINTDGSAFDFTYVNRFSAEKNNKVLIADNEFTSKNVYNNINLGVGLTFKNNVINTAVWINNAVNLTFNGNKIDGSKGWWHTLFFRGNSRNVNIFGNSLTARKGKSNTYEERSQNLREIKEHGNRWFYK